MLLVSVVVFVDLQRATKHYAFILSVHTGNKLSVGREASVFTVMQACVSLHVFMFTELL